MFRQICNTTFIVLGNNGRYRVPINQIRYVKMIDETLINKKRIEIYINDETVSFYTQEGDNDYNTFYNLFFGGNNEFGSNSNNAPENIVTHPTKTKLPSYKTLSSKKQ